MDEAELGLEFSFRGGLELQNILFYFSSQTVYDIRYSNYWMKWMKETSWRRLEDNILVIFPAC